MRTCRATSSDRCRSRSWRRTPPESERRTASGSVIPDNAAEKPDQGEVVAVGPGRRDEAGKLIEMGVKVGDRVLFGKYSGQSVKIDGEEFLVMREEDIMGVLA